MKCPKCGMKMNKTDYCFHCGYMTNGNIIDTQKETPPSELELYFGTKYDKITKNENWYFSGLLGPTYIFCHGYYLIGLLLIIIDSFLSLSIMLLNHAFLYHYIVLLANAVYIVINRVLWATIGNMIYIRLLVLRLNKLERKNKEYYKKEIQNLYSKDNKMIIIKYIIFGLLFLLLFIYIRSIIYNKLGFL